VSQIIYTPGKLTLAKTQKYPTNDPDFSSVSLLLHGDGINGSTTIVDSSLSPKKVLPFGNAQISTTQSKFGGASIAFDGNGDYLSAPSSSDFIFTSSFTTEFWVYRTSITAVFHVFVVGSSANTQFFVSTKSNGQGLRFGLTGVAEYATGTLTWNLNTWYHIALVRDGSSVRFYADGVDVTDGTPTDSTTYSGDIRVGYDVNVSIVVSFAGYIDDLRITKGVARYTGNFTPPTAPFLDF
jgi:hypothetical protein